MAKATGDLIVLITLFFFDLFASPALIMLSWNFVMPEVAGATAINYWKAMVLMFGVSLLFYSQHGFEKRRQNHQEVIQALKALR